MCVSLSAFTEEEKLFGGFFFFGWGVIITDFRYREKLGRELQSEKEAGEARGFGRPPERGSRGLNVEIMFRPALSRRNEARGREAQMPCRR